MIFIVLKQACMDESDCDMISYDTGGQQCFVYSNQNPLGDPGTHNTFYSFPRECTLMSEYSKLYRDPVIKD